MAKIVHVITRFISGGADENTLLTCNHQVESGHEVWLLYGSEVSPRMLALLDSRVSRYCISSLVRQISPWKDLRAICSIVSLYRLILPDIVHTHTSKAGILGRLATYGVPKARVVHGVHILPFPGEPWYRRISFLILEKVAAWRTDAFIDVSDGMRDLCLQHRLGRIDTHHVIASGMDVESFQCAKPAKDILEYVQISDAPPVCILYVAVLERRKRHRELLAALIPQLEANPNMHLFCAGDGPELPVLLSMLTSAKCVEQVHFLGFRDDISNVIAAADICVFASQREGLPRAIVQYAIAAKPIVAMELPGIELVVHEGFNGYLVKSESFGDFANLVSDLSKNPAIRLEMIANSKKLDFSRWDARTMTMEIELIYKKILL